LYESKNRQVRERREQLEDISDIKKKYELMRKYENHGEDWSEEEYEVVYDKFKGIVSVKSPQFRKLAYEVAIELGRTRKSIVWHFKHMFILQDNPKAGEKLLEFKRKVGLTR